MKSPGVIYSIATRLGTPGLGTVSYNAVKALDESGYLKMAVAYGNKSDLRKSKIISLPGNPAKLLFFLPRKYYRPLRNGFLDYITSRIILAKGCSIFHGWNNQALKSIKAAHKIGAKTILESGTTHWLYRTRLLKEEYKKFGIEHLQTPEYAMRSSIEEIDRSDFVFLPSEFAKKTFIESGTDEDKIFVMGRGVDLKGFTPGTKKDKKFKVLFVGRLSLRKGIQYLLEAWEKLKLKDAELILVGSIDDSIKPILPRYNHLDGVVFKGFLKDPIWVQNVFKEATIFVLPSLEEGSAKVTYEAMASGLPVITTENSGSVVRHGLDGFIIPIRDSNAIKERILYFHDNPEMIEVMGSHGMENVKLYTWKIYRDSLIDVFKRVLNT
jgi:glycosyltransferase involved in cell wall biosynthesis